MSFRTVIGRVLDRYFPKIWFRIRVWRRDRHFEPELWLLPAFCDREHTAVDVGANMGEFSSYMARYARDVIAFEPNPDLIPELKRRIPEKVRVYPYALSSCDGTATFRYVPTNTGVATIESFNALAMIEDSASIRSRDVEMRTLDSFGLEKVSFIKIDVEGHEEAVIGGAAGTLLRNRPVLMIESEDRHNPGAPARLRARLLELGYNGYYLERGRLLAIGRLLDRDVGDDGAEVSGDSHIYNYVFLPIETEPAVMDRLERFTSLRRN